MSIQFEDVLTALCSEVKLKHANDAQKIFVLNDAKEARLACDVLIACGFDSKVYAEASASKLYVSLRLPDAAVEQKLVAALTYAQSLKQIKQGLDTLYRDQAPVLQSPDYSILFSNNPAAGKQIVIRFDTAARSEAAVSLPSARVSSSPSAPQPANNPAKVKKKKAGDDPFNYGPEVGGRAVKASGQESAWGEMVNFFTGHMAATMYGVLMGIVALMILYSLFTASKSFLCPDFARENTKRNHAWYCEQ